MYDYNYLFSIIKQLKYLVIFSLFFLIFQFIFGPEFTFEKSINTNISGGPNTRYPSFFQDPQKYAQFLAIGFFVTLIGLRDAFFNKIYTYILCIIIVIAILFTGGRAGFLGLSLGSIILFSLLNRRYKYAILTSGLMLFFILQNYQEKTPLFNRNSTYSDSYEFRSNIWKDASVIVQNNAFFGIGIGNYANYISIHNPDQFWLNENIYTYFDHPENGYLKYLTEFGFIGIISIFSFIIFPIWSSFKYFIKSRDTTSLLLISSVASWLVGFVTVYSFSDTRMFILVSVILCLLYIRPKLVIQND